MSYTMMSNIDTALTYYSSLGTNIKDYSISGLNLYGRVLDIYDGDTINVALQVNNSCYKYNVRMLGIDTCELKSKNNDIKIRAIKARNSLIKYIVGDLESIDLTYNYTRSNIKNMFSKNVYLVWIECSDFEKYGRLLANVFLKEGDQYTLSEMLINNNLGYFYNGGSKMTEEDQLNLIIV